LVTSHLPRPLLRLKPFSSGNPSWCFFFFFFRTKSKTPISLSALCPRAFAVFNLLRHSGYPSLFCGPTRLPPPRSSPFPSVSEARDQCHALYSINFGQLFLVDFPLDENNFPLVVVAISVHDGDPSPDPEFTLWCNLWSVFSSPDDIYLFVFDSSLSIVVALPLCSFLRVDFPSRFIDPTHSPPMMYRLIHSLEVFPSMLFADLLMTPQPVHFSQDPMAVWTY